MSRLGVDVGGTFTDLVALAPDGDVHVAKVRTTPDDPARGLWAAVDIGGAGGDALVHGTTVATNALLERGGGRVALLTTAGFEDLLWLGRQDRAALYDLTRHHPPPLVAPPDVIGVRERVGPAGVVIPLDPEEIRRAAAATAALEPDAVAIVLLFSFLDPSHERALADAVRAALPRVPVVASAEVLPVFREYERASTVTAEAYLRPLVTGYVERLAVEAQRRGFRELRVMASNGGTLDPGQAADRAASLALSGPAGGVEGARLIAAAVGEASVLTLDMGGTSADASVIVDGRPVVQTAGAIAGVPLALPHVLIETVGAGGGSIAWVDRGGALRVGPRSAGAVPGPACYGLGGTEPTVTDAALVLGWLDPERPLASDLVLDPAAAGEAVDRVARAAGLSRTRCAEGIVEVVVATMVRALRRVSVERGLDPRGMTLVPFGGAGPLFTCRLAGSLGMSRAIIPPHPGVLSAIGLAAAPARVEEVAAVHRKAQPDAATALADAFAAIEGAVRAALPDAEIERLADCRYPGQGYELPIRGATPSALAEGFHRLHAERFGHADPSRIVEIVNARVVGSRGGADLRFRAAGQGGPLEALAAGAVVEGPLTLAGVDATLRLEKGWRGSVHPSGALLVEREKTP